jgi:mono/diheme cytochrome c family protein
MSDFSGSAKASPIRRCFVLVMISVATLGLACSGNAPHDAVSPAATVTEQTKNPLLGVANVAIAGKSLYAIHCTMCHGDSGKGEGTAGGSLAVKPSDLTTAEAAAASDGKLFLVIKNGIKKEGKLTMPPAKKVTDEQIWQIVAYVRTLAAR